MIQLQDIHFHYGIKPALQGVTAQIPRGKITLLLGPNGAGKSTLNKIVAGIQFPSRGHIFYGNQAVDQSYQLPYKVGFVGDQETVDRRFKVLEFLTLIGKLRRKKPSKDQLQRWIETFELDSVLNQHVSDLSTGFRQRVSLAAAFLGEPELLLLDEPSSGLDPYQFKTLCNALESVKENCMILVSTHRIKEAEELGDHILLLKEGRLSFEGSREELQALKNSRSIRLHLENVPSQKMEADLKVFGFAATDQKQIYEAENKDMREAIQFVSNHDELNVRSLGLKESRLEELFFNTMEEGKTQPLNIAACEEEYSSMEPQSIQVKSALKPQNQQVSDHPKQEGQSSHEATNTETIARNNTGEEQ